VNLPTAALGYVWGPLRVERNGGGDVYLPGQGGLLINRKPFAVNESGDLFAVTHLQKKSRFGFLVMANERWWHLAVHIWFVFVYQAKDPDGKWIPGSEVIFYWRCGYSRWDAGDGKYVMGWTRRVWKWVIKIPIGTWYGPGLHLD
jgi:hypothetical protein